MSFSCRFSSSPPSQRRYIFSSVFHFRFWCALRRRNDKTKRNDDWSRFYLLSSTTKWQTMFQNMMKNAIEKYCVPFITKILFYLNDCCRSLSYFFFLCILIFRDIETFVMDYLPLSDFSFYFFAIFFFFFFIFG